MDNELLITIDSEVPSPGSLRVDGRSARVDPERFLAFARDHALRPEYARAIFIGDGQPLEQHGFALVAAARAGGFAHVRLITSPRRLTEARQVRAVVMTGVDEFSLGLHGHTSELHDRLTQRPDEFAKLQTCFERLANHDVAVHVDTVITTANLDTLPDIAAIAIAAGARHIHLHPYCPRSDDAEARSLIVGLDDLLPALTTVLAQCRAAGVDVRVQHVPMCLLGEHVRVALDNRTPDAFDGVRPGRPLPEFNCLLEAKCEHAEACLGLSHAYVNAFGWEFERLRPSPRVRAWVERDRSVERSTGATAGPRGHAAWLALLGEHAGRVANVSLTRSEARYPMQMGSGPDATRFVLVIAARDEVSRTFTQTRSFNLAYTDVDGPAAELDIAVFLEPIFAAIRLHDDGSLSLDPKR
jgi:hypothetical protein